MKALDILSKVAGSHALTLQSKSPTIFFVAGVVGVVASTVLACRATLNLEETLDQIEVDIADNYPDDDNPDQNVQIVFRVRSAVTIARLYAPAVIIGGASIVMLTKSHSDLTKRNAALSAAYTALDKGFRDYRARVVEKYGPEEDDRLRYGFVTEKAKTVDGKKVLAVDRVNPETGASIYAKFFDQLNPNFEKDPEYNKLFLRSQQNYLTDLLHSRGHVFLNEAYVALGFNHTRTGAVVGWVVSDDSDNYVDFGIFNGHAGESVRDFVNGHEAAVLVDFNVDGVIVNRIKDDTVPVNSKNRWFGL